MFQYYQLCDALLPGVNTCLLSPKAKLSVCGAFLQERVALYLQYPEFLHKMAPYTPDLCLPALCFLRAWPECEGCRGMRYLGCLEALRPSFQKPPLAVLRVPRKQTKLPETRGLNADLIGSSHLCCVVVTLFCLFRLGRLCSFAVKWNRDNFNSTLPLQATCIKFWGNFFL